jgi:SAM-dependent methyltransferase
MTVLQEQSYFAQHVGRDFEAERLLNMQGALDPLTERRLARLDVGPGWTCLEVGAGRGSIARWLAERVAPRGRVVATDINVRHLDHLYGPYIDVREHDIETDELEVEAFDLVHSRLVLMYLADPERAIEKMVSALRPGGWLVLEEPMFVEPCILTRDHIAAGACERVYRAFADLLSSYMDLSLGARVMEIVAGLGLDEFYSEQTRMYTRGGLPGPITYMLTWEVFRAELLASDAIHPDDIDVASAAMLDPAFVGSGPFIFGVFGRKRWA